jgi:GNAT superfamily N-acetyltransferase
MSDTWVREASEGDVPLILSFIRELAEYEKLSDEVVATEDGLRESLFGERRYAEVLIAEHDGVPAGFALFFHNFSTFLGQPGIYLEDLYVRPEFRGSGIGKQLLGRLAHLAVKRGCGRLEWWVLDWNEPSIGFYKQLGAVAMDDWTVYRVSGDALRKLGGGG